jgi:hypothetical protein
MTKSKKSLFSKLEIKNKITEQTTSFESVKVEITSNGSLQTELKQEANKATRIARCLNDPKQRTKCKNICVIRPIPTYAAEARAYTINTK